MSQKPTRPKSCRRKKVEKLGSWVPADRQGRPICGARSWQLVKHFKADVKTLFVDLPKEVRDAFLFTNQRGS